MGKHVVKKDNRVLTVDEAELKSYLIRGYDEIDGSGDVVKPAEGGREVTIEEFNKVNEELKKLKKRAVTTDAEALKDRIKELEEENAALVEDVKMLEAAVEETKATKKK